jgi:hypothetical protein
MIVATTLSTISRVFAQEIQLNWQQFIANDELAYTSGEIK